MKLLFSEDADTDLLNILSYISERNRPAARRLAELFDTKIKNLTYFPFIGRDRSMFARHLRSIAADNYVIFYRVLQDRILVVRILDGRRDLKAEFDR